MYHDRLDATSLILKVPNPASHLDGSGCRALDQAMVSVRVDGLAAERAALWSATGLATLIHIESTELRSIEPVARVQSSRLRNHHFPGEWHTAKVWNTSFRT
jgi:hypothetical protein